MDLIRNGWFSEINDLWPGQCFSLEVTEVAYKGRSDFQDLMILKTKSHGAALILDGIIQCTERDEFSYQEMISFLPLCAHPKPSKVLIVGGGDGGVAREVTKHTLVKEIVQVEIDQKVVEISKQYLPFLAEGFKSPKLTLKIGDGFKFMEEHKNEFDVIITDSSDPVGPAVNLFTGSYFKLLKEALKPNGIICSQGGTVWSDLDQVKKTMDNCRKHFPVVEYAYSNVPTYPDGQIGYVVASLAAECDLKKPVHVLSETDLDNMKLKYYNSEIHSASFVLPNFVRKGLL